MAEQEPKLSIDSIAPPTDDTPKSADPNTADELKHSQEMHDLERQSYRQDITERKKYANKVYWLVVSWLIGVALLVVGCGLCDFTISCKGWVANLKFQLPEKVLIAIISGTTVNVLGLFAIVCNYLFPKEKKK